MKAERLDKILAAQTAALSRKDVKELVRRGRVLVNGAPAARPDVKVDLETDAVMVDGVMVVLQRHLYLMMDKPKGVVSATRDGRDRTVVDLVPAEIKRDGLFPAGRLDRDTTGFVLLTDDGDFAHRILSPKRHVPKTYHVELDGSLEEGIAARFREGLVLGDQTICKPARFTPLGANRAQVVLTEGMYHQIKRMFACCGLQVVELRRVRMGALWLDDRLKPGECRPLTAEEVAQITQTPTDLDATAPNLEKK